MSKKLLLILSIILSSLIISCNTDDKTGAGDDNKVVPPTKEEITKYVGTWAGALPKTSGDQGPADIEAIIIINNDGSITEDLAKQTVTLDKIIKSSDNIFTFTTEGTVEGTKITLEYKVDFNSSSPKATVVATVPRDAKVSKYTYEGNLQKQAGKVN